MLTRLCNVIKKCMRVLGIKFKPYAVDYFEVIQEVFTVTPLPDFLYSLETSVSVFGKVPEMIEPLKNMYEFISKQTLQLLDGNDIKEHNELCEDFFGLLFRYTKYIPSVILSSQTLDINLHLAEIMIGIEQPNVEKTLYMFLEYFFKLTSYNPQSDVERVNLYSSF